MFRFVGIARTSIVYIAQKPIVLLEIWLHSPEFFWKVAYWQILHSPVR
jgi:hypothetical protein